jgi:hypothetical protein
MPVALSQAAVVSYLFVALFGLFILRRAYRLTQGVPLSTPRLVVLPVLYVLLYVGELASVSFVGVSSSIAPLTYLSLGVDAALLGTGVWLAYGYTLRHVQLYRAPGETYWSYRMNALLPVAYVVLFFARVGIETAILGESPFEFPTAASLAGLSTFSLLLFAVVDALWGLSTGFLVGRSAAAWHEWQRRLATGTPAGDAALA